VIRPVFLRQSLRFLHDLEPVLVQTFVPKPPVEALDVSVLHRSSRLDELQLHVTRMRPLDVTSLF